MKSSIQQSRLSQFACPILYKLPFPAGFSSPLWWRRDLLTRSTGASWCHSVQMTTSHVPATLSFKTQVPENRLLRHSVFERFGDLDKKTDYEFLSYSRRSTSSRASPFNSTSLPNATSNFVHSMNYGVTLLQLVGRCRLEATSMRSAFLCHECPSRSDCSILPCLTIACSDSTNGMERNL